MRVCVILASVAFVNDGRMYWIGLDMRWLDRVLQT